MNICSYVMASSCMPKLYTIALEHESQSLDNLMENGDCVLQLLTHSHLGVIRTLGKKSGRHINKEDYLEKKDMLETWKNYPVLKHCAAYLHLSKLDQIPSGDHNLLLFQVNGFKSITDRDILMWQDLINNKIIL